MLLQEIHFSAICFFCVAAQDYLTRTDQYLLKTNWCIGAKIILNRFLLFWLQRLGQSKNFSRQIFFSLINSDFKISYTFVLLIVGWKRSFLFTSNTLKPYNWLKEYYILCELLSSATTTWNGLYRPLWNRKHQAILFRSSNYNPWVTLRWATYKNRQIS